MRDFLIDTNIFQYWFNPNCQEHKSVLKKAGEVPKESKLWISAVTWGEIEYGYWCLKIGGQSSLEKEFRQFVKTLTLIEYPIDQHVTEVYGKIRARLFENCAPPAVKKKKRPEQLIDPATSLELRIQENDLWIVSQAVTRNITLVTNDKKSLRPLLQAVKDAGEALYVDNWAD